MSKDELISEPAEKGNCKKIKNFVTCSSGTKQLLMECAKVDANCVLVVHLKAYCSRCMVSSLIESMCKFIIAIGISLTCRTRNDEAEEISQHYVVLQDVSVYYLPHVPPGNAPTLQITTCFLKPLVNMAHHFDL